MAISRIIGASLVSDLDRQGVDLQFTTLGNALVYMDFANFRLGVGNSAPTHELTVAGGAKLSNLIIQGDAITSETGVIDLGSNTNIRITGGSLNSILTTDGSGNVFWADALANIIFTGNSSFSIINANVIYEDSYRVLTSNSNIIINGDAIGSGTSSNIYVELSSTGVVAGTYGSADDEYIDFVPKITVDSKGRITNIANVTLTQVGNVSFIDTTISTTSNITLAPAAGYIFANSSQIKDVQDPIDNQDAATKGYVDGAISSTASKILIDDSSVEVIDDGIDPAVVTITIDGNVVGNVTTESTEFYTTYVNIGNLSIYNRTISSNGNIILDALGTGTVQFAGSDAVWLPTGNETTRPANPEVGYIRYNTDRENIEYWTGTVWEAPGESFVTSEVLSPDGVSNIFTLGSNCTTEGTLVSINGTLQQPTYSYTIVNNNQIQFTETPLSSDVIEVRGITVGAVTISRLTYGNAAVSLLTGNIVVTGHLLPSANVTYDIGNDSNRWRDLYLSGNTINLGGMTLSNDSGVFKARVGNVAVKLQADDPVDNADVVTLGYLNTSLSALNSAVISSDDSSISIVDDGVSQGNIVVVVENANVAFFGNDSVILERELRLTSALAVTEGGTGSTTSAGALNNLLPSGEQSGYVLKTSGPGTYYWASESGGGGATVGQQLTTLRQSNTATSGQTVFDLIGIGYTPGAGQLRVYINGVRQHPGAYTETSANSYTLSSGVNAGTEVFAEIDQFSSFNNYANLTYASNIGNIQAVGLTVQSAIDGLETSKAPLADPVFSGYVKIQNPLEITEGGTGATTSDDALNNLLPSGEQSGYVLKTSGPGTYYWASESGGGGATVGQQLTTTRQANTATAGQSLFTLVGGRSYTPGAGQLRVYVNGVRQYPSEYTETSNVSYTITGGVSSGDLVLAEIDQFSTFNNYANLTYASNVGNVSASGLTVQSAIENLETNKAPLASPVFTGNPSINGLSIGFKELPQLTTSNVTLALADSGKHFYVSSAGTYWYQVPSNANVAFPLGTTVVIVNRTTGNITANTQAGVSMYLAGNATTGNRTITAYGMATLIKTGTNEWFINGTGVV